MLPRLRHSLDFFPSPVPDRPGLVIRDPFLYSDATLIVPPALAPCLEFFDGEHSTLDLRAYLVRATGQLDVGQLEQHLIDTLSSAGFLEDDAFLQRKEAAEKAFAEAPIREPAHAGSGYPDEKSELVSTLNEYLGDARPDSQPSPIAIAAPHVSPFGGVDAYRAAYSSLSPSDADRTFVVLGTSHYGQPDRLGLTRKPFVTPFGETIPDTRLIDELLAKSGDAAAMEDYCHSVEHSIEFQIVFLQHLFGPNIRVVPILCGSYATSIYKGGPPEANEHVNRMLGALGEIAAREGNRLLWVLGIDMAHMGRRYGDPFTALAHRDEMSEVARRDRLRMECMEAGDARGFWDLVQESRDDLKWCGSAPVYTFLKAVPQARGELLHYQQWNIDDQSVVSFAGMRFHSH
ncbi:MAG TPA: AmmeMemoRadiSam system protein B [Bryobacteraceae bacterium]|nr:AmmeMemoRadiSam system protein B [Bryobacteraceae bacterium]